MLITFFTAGIYLAASTTLNPGTWRIYALVIALVLTAFSLYVLIRQIFADETGRKAVSERLEAADEKYRSLLETSEDGTLLIMDGKIIFANVVLMAMSGYTHTELSEMEFEELFKGEGEDGISPENLQRESGDSGHTMNLEARISCKRGNMRDVALAISNIKIMDSEGLIVIIRDMSGREKMEHESTQLQNELHSSILMMNLPIASLAREFFSCDMDTPVHEAAAIMKRKDRDALIITRDGNDPVGILTDSDLRNRILARELDYRNPVFEIMSSPLIRISDQSLLYEGILQFREHSISHLAVEDRNGKISGIFSNKNLLEVQRNSISFLIREINAANTVEALKKIHDRIPVLVKVLMESGAKISNVTYMISTVTDAITHRLIEFAIEEMGKPPARFVFMALGSEGRREQTLVTDQDNAIIIEDVPNDRFSEVNRYFLYFGKKINLWLDRIGYQYCKGEIMAGNPRWCQPVARWKDYFTDWVGQKSAEGLLGMAIFFDFRIVYGEEHLARELRQHIHKTISGGELFFSYLAKEVAQYDIPANIFRSNGSGTGASVPESINIKNALSPLTGFIRVYALQNKISESNSLQRLQKLLRLNILPEPDCHELENMYSRLMEIRFRSQVNAILANRAPDNMVEQDELTAIEQTMVRKSFSEIKRFQEIITDNFST